MKAPKVSTLTRIRLQIDESLTRLNSRERNIIIAGAVLIAITTLWLLFGWQTKTHQELDRSLPRAAAQLSRMQLDSAELARLRGLPAPAAPVLSEMVTVLGGTATAHGLKLNIRNDGNQLVISGKGIDVDKWIPWLAETQANHALRLSYLDITQTPGGPQLEARLASR